MSTLLASYVLNTRTKTREIMQRSATQGDDEGGGGSLGKKRPVLKAGLILSLNLILGIFAGLVLSALELPEELKARNETAALVARLNSSMALADWEALLSALGSDAAALQADVVAVESGTLHLLDANWDASGSFFFAFTIATTLGYGTFAPVTPGGRLFTIVYALVSIPLMAMAFIKYVTRRCLELGKPSHPA